MIDVAADWWVCIGYELNLLIFILNVDGDLCAKKLRTLVAVRSAGYYYMLYINLLESIEYNFYSQNSISKTTQHPNFSNNIHRIPPFRLILKKM